MYEGASERASERQRGREEKESNDTMQVTARAPHRPCLISFVPAVSSAFFPLTARQPWSVVAASRSRVALKLLKWKRVCHSHYVRLSLGAPSSPLLAFHLPSLFLFLSRASLYTYTRTTRVSLSLNFYEFYEHKKLIWYIYIYISRLRLANSYISGRNVARKDRKKEKKK